MSLGPKIDEIALTLTQENVDVAFLTETWLRQYIPNNPINIAGYQLFRRDPCMVGCMLLTAHG